MILLIDSYDSFSFNLYQLAGSICPDVRVVRNDELSVRQIRELAPSRIILSPGPGRPENAGILLEAAQTIAQEIPTLGVCLGHQAVCLAYGARITYAKSLMHGKQSKTFLDTDSRLFQNCPASALTARYHSLAAAPESIPECLKVTAWTEDGEVMAVEHREFPIFGVQFHPESILTSCGRRILENFLTHERRQA